MKRRKRQIDKANNKQKASQREQIHRILDLVMDRNEGGKSTFFEFVGHVNGIRIISYEGKWKYEHNQEYISLISYLDGYGGYSLDELEAALCGK